MAAQQRDADQQESSAGRLVGLGAQFAGAIVLCVFAGQWVDRRFGVDPWGVLVGAMVGFAVGMLALVRAGRGAGLTGRPDQQDGEE